MEIKSYRKINQNCDFFKSYEEAVLEGKLAIEKSVKNWMLSDVPIICSLSGGLDSSLIASIFSKNSNKKLGLFLLVSLEKILNMMREITLRN